jgi:hypothetical protein
MGNSALQAAAFYRDVARQGFLYTIRDEGGYPAPLRGDGRRAQPFWSSETRIARVARACPEYAAFAPERVPWDHFVEVRVPDLEKDGVLIGVNWSGPTASGYDLEPREVVANVESYLREAP